MSKMRAGVAFYECVNRSKNERPLIFATWLREESEQCGAFFECVVSKAKCA